MQFDINDATEIMGDLSYKKSPSVITYYMQKNNISLFSRE